MSLVQEANGWRRRAMMPWPWWLKEKGKERDNELANANDQWVQGCLGISAWVQERVELDPQSMH